MKKDNKLERGITLISLIITIILLLVLAYNFKEYILPTDAFDKAESAQDTSSTEITEGQNKIDKINEEFMEVPNEIISENEIIYE